MSRKVRGKQNAGEGYNYYRRVVEGYGVEPMSRKQWERYRQEEIVKLQNLGKEVNLFNINQRIAGISAGLVDEDQYMGQMRARARQLYIEGKLQSNPDFMSDMQLMRNDTIQLDRINLKKGYAEMRAAYEDALAKGQKLYVYNGETYLVEAGLGKAFSQAFFGSN